MKNSIKKNKHLLNSQQSLLSKFFLSLNIANIRLLINAKKQTRNEQINANIYAWILCKKQRIVDLKVKERGSWRRWRQNSLTSRHYLFVDRKVEEKWAVLACELFAGIVLPRRSTPRKSCVAG